MTEPKDNNHFLSEKITFIYLNRKEFINKGREVFLKFKIKEVIGMIFIQQVYEDVDMKSEYVRCPSCKRGRLCDKPKGDIATVIALKTDHQEKTGSKIILKCPKCSQKFLIHFSKE